MNTASTRTASQQIAGEIQLARLRVAKAENQLKAAKAQARLARRRRKEAKQAARRAKKQAKLAKQEFAEAKLALAEAEAKLLRSRKSTARIKNRKAPARKAIPTPDRRKAAKLSAVPLRKVAKSRLPRSTSTKPASNAKPKLRGVPPPVALPMDLEMPTATASLPAGEATVLTKKTSGESQTAENEALNPVAPASADSQTG